MTIAEATLVPVLLLSLAAAAIAHESKPAADLVVANARVWTGDPGQPEVEGLAVVGERIAATGSTAEIEG